MKSFVNKEIELRKEIINEITMSLNNKNQEMISYKDFDFKIADMEGSEFQLDKIFINEDELILEIGYLYIDEDEDDEMELQYMEAINLPSWYLIRILESVESSYGKLLV